MATQRPLKEGSVRTYQEKVALGFPDILASEMDADLDTIYAAWNGGISTAELKDNAVTSAKIVVGAVGTRELADLGVATGDLADNAVTSAKIAAGAVGSTQLADLGVATGDLADGAVTWPKIGARQVFVDNLAYARPATNYQLTVTETAFMGTPSITTQLNRPVGIWVALGGYCTATAPPMGSSVLAVFRLRLTNVAGALISEQTRPFILTGTGTFPLSTTLVGVHVPSATGAQIYAVTAYVTGTVGGSQAWVTGVEALVLPFA